MQQGYFEQSWADLRRSPGVALRLLQLTLISLVPVLGWAVVVGYALLWAREAAWGMRTALPGHVIPRSGDGMLRRGFFALLIACLFALFPFGASLLLGVVTSFFGHFGLEWPNPSGFRTWVAPVLVLGCACLSFALSLVGMMRMTVYGRLAPGLQLDRIVRMARHRPSGLVRIVGLAVLLASGLVLVLVAFMLVVGVIAAMMYALFAGGAPSGGSFGPHRSAVFLVGVLVSASAYVLAAVVCSSLFVISSLLLMRSMGLWARQFDVPSWDGQDDPMPFELAGHADAASPVAG